MKCTTNKIHFPCRVTPQIGNYVVKQALTMDKIDGKLLIRYHQNTCTAAERALVESWLRGELDDEQTDHTPLPRIQEDALERQLWETIAKELPSAKKAIRLHRYKTWLPYAAAVILPLLLWPFASHEHLFARVATLDNMRGLATETFDYQDLKIELAAGSTCHIYSSLFGTIEKIDFDGALAITNHAAVQTTVQIVSPDRHCADKRWKDNVHLSAGGRYMALIDAECGLVAATNSELQDGLPIGVKTEIQKYFTL